ncbi:MAG TPA: reverse transcriptase domain-containing protein, partial [Candidatus Obscuribacterales bacterium]
MLKPRQLGVGIKGGAEALAHGGRRYLESMPDSHALVKLDFSNAFNSLRRDCMFEAVLQHAPELAGYVVSAYGSPSSLNFGDFVVESAEGIQQGDPLGPLLFCLTIHPLLLDIKSDFISGYLDDIAVGGETSKVASDVRNLSTQALKLGLELNQQKCEVISKAHHDQHVFGFSFKQTPLHEATLLGTPITSGGINCALTSKRTDLDLLLKRLTLIPSHAALYLLRNAFAIPKLLYLLRTSPCFDSPELDQYDKSLQAALSSLLNVDLSSDAWTQANLPVRWGGIGVRSAHQLAPSAFLASAAGAAELLSLLLPSAILSIPDSTLPKAMLAWTALGGSLTPSGLDARKQRIWDDQLCQKAALQLREGKDEYASARLLAVCSSGAGAWLNAIPISTLGLNLDNSALRIAVGLRLGVPLVLPHQCSCGVHVDKFAHHGLACRKSAGRHLRHNLMNDTILRALQSADIPAVREPPGLTRTDSKRPDGATLVPWAHGRCLLWDATTPDTLAPSHVQRTALQAGAAAATAEAAKVAKYASLSVAHDFVPVAIETMGTWGPAAWDFINQLGRRISAVSGDSRATAFLRQRLSLAV